MQFRAVANSRQLQGRYARRATTMGDPTVRVGQEGALADLRREVDVMRSLDHPHLVKLYEVIDDRESGKLLMVVEYCECGALVRPGQLTPDRRMPEAIAQFYFRQMAAGLAYLHENSVVHGDMKPENVLLSGTATVKIADFGQARVMQEGAETMRRTLGTPPFLAPEICAGGDYKGRPADVWALGVSLYSFLYGELPFKGTSLSDLYDCIAAAEVPFPPGVPLSIELQDLLLRMLCPDPDARITALQVLNHTWVQDQDLFFLMPSLFSESNPTSPPAAQDSSSPSADGGSPAGGSPLAYATAATAKLAMSLTGSSSRSLLGATPQGGSPTFPRGSSPPRLGQEYAPPTAADVAAAVFPSLHRTDSLAPDPSLGGPEISIVGALMHAATHTNKLAQNLSGRLHRLTGDSLMHGTRDVASRATGSTSGVGEGSPTRTGSAEAEGTTNASPGPVTPSARAPSSFSLMAEQMQQVQADLLQQQRHGEQGGPRQPASLGAVHAAVMRGPSGNLHPIEESTDLDGAASLLTAPFASGPTSHGGAASLPSGLSDSVAAAGLQHAGSGASDTLPAQSGAVRRLALTGSGGRVVSPFVSQSSLHSSSSMGPASPVEQQQAADDAASAQTVPSGTSASPQPRAVAFETGSGADAAADEGAAARESRRSVSEGISGATLCGQVDPSL